MNKLRQKIKLIISPIFFAVFLFAIFHVVSFAQEYSSSNYKISNPVITSGGGYSSSANFGLQSSIGQIGIGTSSAASFGLNAGFLYFPYVTTPAISATPGNGQVSLSWTAANGILGWTASGYDIGYSTVSGGPYTFGSSLGNVLSATQAGLNNGTTYYFVVRVEDAFQNIIAISSQVSAAPVAPSVCTDHNATNYGGTLPCTYPTGGGGGGGGGSSGGGSSSSQTGVIFSGRAYPLSNVSVLEDGQLAVTTIADPNANFNISLLGLSAGNYTFSVYGEDSEGRRSSLFTFPVFITSGVVTNIGGIFIAPTIAVDKSEVKRGDNIAIFGQSASQADIIISVHSAQEVFATTSSDKNGIYLYNFDTSQIDYGEHNTQSKAAVDQAISDYSNSVSFNVGTENVIASAPKQCPLKGDLNGDCKVDLVDFSIAAYWYKQPLSDAFKKIEKAELNGDGKVDLVDFSIMAYYWTG
jgi:hypothetical protein